MIQADSRISFRIRAVLYPACVVAVLLVAVCAVLHMSPHKLALVAHDHLPAIDRMLLMRFRLPRLLMAIMVGSGMAVAGWTAQKSTRNPLASPDILTVPAAAALAITLTLWLTDGQILGAYTLPIIAAASGIIVSIILFTVVGRRHQLDGSGFLLVGIALGAVLAAANFFIELNVPLSSQGQSRGAAFMSGQLQRASWDYVWLLLPAWWLLILATIAMGGRLAALQFDDEIVTQLGGSTQRWRRTGLCLSGALCASCIGVAGGFGFIGFVAPHIARSMAGGKRGDGVRRGIADSPWTTALIGAALLLSADALGQYLRYPDQIPAGNVVALLGGPLFLIFTFRRRLIQRG